jgi:hypothetical protein
VSKMLMVTKVTVTHRIVLKDLGGVASLESDGIGNHYRRNTRKSTKDNRGDVPPGRRFLWTAVALNRFSFTTTSPFASVNGTY